MKRKWTFMMLFVFLTAVMQFSQGYAEEKFPLDGWPKGVICGGGSPGSAYYNTMIAVSELSRKYLGVKATTIATAPGSAAGVRGLDKKELEFATALDQTVYWACKSIGPYEGKPPVKNVRAVAGSHMVLVGFVTDAKYGIKSMADLKGTGFTISVHPAGSRAFSAVADAVLEFYKLGPEDVNAVPHSSAAEVAAGLKEGRYRVVVDAVYASTSHPWLMEVDRDIDMRMISLSPECIEFVGKKIMGFVPGTVPPGLYRGVTEDIHTVGVAAGVFCRADMPDTFIYELTKLIFEEPSRAQWLSFGPSLKEYTPDKIKAFLSPVHAGAMKYYKEKGIWTDELEQRRNKMLAELGLKE